MLNRCYLVWAAFSCAAISVTGLSVRAFSHAPLPNCAFSSSSKEATFGEASKIYRIIFLQDIPLPLTPSQTHFFSRSFTSFYQAGKFISGGSDTIYGNAPDGPEFDSHQPYCGFVFMSGLASNDGFAAIDRGDTSVLHSLLKANKKIEFESVNQQRTIYRDGKRILPEANLINHSLLSLYDYERNKRSFSEDGLDMAAAIGDGVFAMGCHAGKSEEGNEENLTVEMVLKALPIDSIKIEERSIDYTSCDQ